jgi:GTP-binding protein
VLVHLVDVSDGSGRPDPVDDFKIITAELKGFDAELVKRPTVLVAAKIDVADPARLKKLTTFAKRKKLPLYPISSVTGEGVEALKYAIAALVEQHRPLPMDEPVTPKRKLKPAFPPPKASVRSRV